VTADLVVFGQLLSQDGIGMDGAVAVRGGRIFAVGSPADLGGTVGKTTQVLRAGADLIVPGFVDAHVHFVEGGLSLGRLQMGGVGSRDEFSDVVREAGAGGAEGDWILGGGWNEHRWDGEVPHRDWIDRPLSDNDATTRPTYLSRMDMHTAVANAAALERAGIGPDTPDPLGGRIERDEKGDATGILRDTAMELVARHIPTLSDRQLDDAIDRAVSHALSLGVTQVHDMGRVPGANPEFDLDAYLRAEVEGRLGLRLYAATPIVMQEEAARLVQREGTGRGMVRWGAVKAFMDGSLGSATAWFHRPYLHQHENCGLAVVDPKELGERLEAAVGAGLQPIVHAIGDRANDELLDQYTRCVRYKDPAALPFRVEHAQHLSPELIQRFGDLPVAASMQPAHLAFDGVTADGWLGSERTRWCFAMKSLMDGGVPVGFGSDWTVVPLDPIPGYTRP